MRTVPVGSAASDCCVPRLHRALGQQAAQVLKGCHGARHVLHQAARSRTAIRAAMVPMPAEFHRLEAPRAGIAAGTAPTPIDVSHRTRLVRIRSATKVASREQPVGRHVQRMAEPGAPNRSGTLSASARRPAPEAWVCRSTSTGDLDHASRRQPPDPARAAPGATAPTSHLAFHETDAGEVRFQRGGRLSGRLSIADLAASFKRLDAI